LVLFHVTSGAFETTDVRQKLGINAKAKSSSVKPAQVPAGYELYVQSTSPNRKLPAGYVLLEGDPSIVPSNTTKSAAKPPPTKKRKRGDDEAEPDEADGDVDETANKSGFVKWSLVENLDAADEGVDEEQMVHRSGDLEFCDESVPEDVLEATNEDILVALTSVTDWRELQIVHFPNDGGQKRQWQSHKSGARLFYFYTQDLAMIALEHTGRCGIVFGVAGGHPFIQTNRFGYGNSDGSSDFRPIPGRVTPAKVLSQLMGDVWYHGHDSVH
jgi:hypothetical protein